MRVSLPGGRSLAHAVGGRLVKRNRGVRRAGNHGVTRIASRSSVIVPRDCVGTIRAFCRALEKVSAPILTLCSLYGRQSENCEVGLMRTTLRNPLRGAVV